MKKISLLFLILVIAGVFYFNASLESNEEQTLNIYSSRKEKFISELVNNFSTETGIKINILIDKAPKLIAKLKNEKNLSPADILITSDIINITKAKQEGLLTPIKDPEIENLSPPIYRDNQNYWVGLSLRKRLIFFNNNLTNGKNIKNYEDLANSELKGKLLIRSSSNPYNQALISKIFINNGLEKTQEILKNINNNFVRPPQGGDTDQLKALAKGIGSYAVANNYYYMRLKFSDDPKNQEYVKNISVIYPNQDTDGTHINLSTIAITKSSKNTKAATEFIKYLLSQKAQKYFVERNYEESVNLNLNSSENYKKDLTNLKKIPTYSIKAIKLADESGWK